MASDHIIQTILRMQDDGILWIEFIAASEEDRDIINAFSEAIDHIDDLLWQRHYYLNTPVGTVPDNPPYTKYGSYAFMVKKKE